jgi:hypothetical protein
MKNVVAGNEVLKRRVLDNKDLRDVYYEEIKTRRAKREGQREETDVEREQRTWRLWKRLAYDPNAHVDHAPKQSAAEAWMEQHWEEVPALKGGARWRRLVKAAQARLREIGIH